MLILIGFGLTFEVFAVAVSQGCVLGNVQGKKMTLMCLIVGAWQAVSLAIGYGIASFPNIETMDKPVQMGWQMVAATIFIAAGGIKIFLIHSKKAVPEVRSDINFKKICGIAASVSIYTLFVGIGCGFLLLSFAKMIISIFVLTVGLVIAGVYVGYRNGELDKRLYISGGAFLIIAGVLTILSYLEWYLHG